MGFIFCLFLIFLSLVLAALTHGKLLSWRGERNLFPSLQQLFCWFSTQNRLLFTHSFLQMVISNSGDAGFRQGTGDAWWLYRHGLSLSFSVVFCFFTLVGFFFLSDLVFFFFFFHSSMTPSTHPPKMQWTSLRMIGPIPLIPIDTPRVAWYTFFSIKLNLSLSNTFV